MSGEPKVRGRDFVAYRIGGAVAALLLGLALLWQGWELFDGDAMTAPESAWGAAVIRGEPVAADGGESELLAAEVLTARTRLQNERFLTGPSPGAAAPDLAVGQGEFLTEQPMARDPTLPRAWLEETRGRTDLLLPEDRVVGLSSLPYVNANLFERPAARDWRFGMADFVSHLGALAILGFSFLLAVMLALRGRVPISHGRSGRTVKRFTFIERSVHWMTSLSFLTLALTGIVLAYGVTLLAPLGEGLLGQAGWIATWAHMMAGLPFALGILAMAVMWTGRNLPSKLDVQWLAEAGGMFSDTRHPSARKFNAGQKLIFWSAVLGGLVMVASGVTLMFPYWWLGLGTMGWVMLIHALVGVLLIAVFIGHIYIGTVGMQGAFWAMWSGDVDWNWAAEHHDLWLAEVAGGGEAKPEPAGGREATA